jgi:hypothetical protein
MDEKMAVLMADSSVEMRALLMDENKAELKAVSTVEMKVALRAELRVAASD